VAFPGEPKKTTQTVETPAGRQGLYAYQVETPGRFSYTVIFSNTPDVLMRGANVDAMLDNGVQGMGRQWRIEKTEPIRLGEHPGRAVSFVVPAGNGLEEGLGRGRIYQVGNRLYQILAIGPASKATPDQLEGFLKSFELMNPVAGSAAPAAPAAPMAPAAPAVAQATEAKAGGSGEPGAGELPTDAGSGPDPSGPAESSLGLVVGEGAQEDLPQPKLGGDNESFREVAPAGGVLVGVKVGYIDAFGGNKVGAIWPVFQVDQAYVVGARAGMEMEPTATVVARPGYAVGAIHVRAGMLLDAFQLVFMRVRDGRLDAADAYQSEWLGDPRGGNLGEVSGSGRPVVGLHGKTNGREINALGLVVPMR
jgi:hypothetical protein